MPKRPNAESRLISALINTRDSHAAETYGVRPEMFSQYQSEYRWVRDYQSRYKDHPSQESMEVKFPDFPYTPEYSEVAFVCDEVKERHHRQQMVKALKNAGEAIRAGDTDEAYMHFMSVQHPSNTVAIRLTNALTDLTFLDTYSDPINTIEMPWKTLQQNTGGIAAGDLWTVAGRLKQGKSWTLSSVMVHALMNNHKVMMFSCEMPTVQVMARVHTMMAYELGIKDVRHSDLHGRSYDPIAYRRLVAQINERVSGELFVIDTSHGAISTGTIASMSKEMEFVVVDHMGLLVSPTGTRAVQDWREMAVISNVLKETAMINQIPILSAAQINREGDSVGWRPPKAKHVAQSDAIGQDSNLLLTMKRRSKTVMTYSIEAQRSGESGVLFSTRFLPNEGRFEEITMDRAKDIASTDEMMEDE